MTLRTASLNLGDGPWRNKARDLDHLANLADAIGLQEAGDRRRDLERWCERHGWRYCIGDGGPGAASVPILVAPGVELDRDVAHEAVPPTFVGEPGAGPAVVKFKVVMRVKVRVDSGRDDDRYDVHHVLNTHFTPSVGRKSLSNWPKRVAHYRRQATVLVDLAERKAGRGETVTVVGDFNAEPDFWLLRRLRRRFDQVVDEPTHGRRLIDHIWTNGRARSVSVIETSSDHDAVVAVIHPRRGAA